MKIEVTGDGLKLLQDFIKYANLDPEVMASGMFYELDGFIRRLKHLEKAMNTAQERM